MNNPKVSVLTPIYNHKIEYVEQCLESLKNQKIKHYLESIKEKTHIDFKTRSLYIN